MSHPSKIKGNKFERDCCKLAEVFEIPNKRAWGSDGRSRGLAQEVDMVIEDNIYVQCKKRKVLAKHLKPTKEIHVQFVGEDRGENLAIMSQDYYLSLIAMIKEFKDK